MYWNGSGWVGLGGVGVCTLSPPSGDFVFDYTNALIPWAEVYPADGCSGQNIPEFSPNQALGKVCPMESVD